MAAPTRPVPTGQQSAFEFAVAERLGIDPTKASLNTWRVDDEIGVVTLDFYLDSDELLEMFNTGQVPDGYELHVEWHIEYATPGENDWTKHLRTTGEEASKVAVAELRAADPAHSYRVVRQHFSARVEGW